MGLKLPRQKEKQNGGRADMTVMGWGFELIEAIGTDTELDALA